MHMECHKDESIFSEGKRETYDGCTVIVPVAINLIKNHFAGKETVKMNENNRLLSLVGNEAERMSKLNSETEESKKLSENWKKMVKRSI